MADRLNGKICLVTVHLLELDRLLSKLFKKSYFTKYGFSNVLRYFISYPYMFMILEIVDKVHTRKEVNHHILRQSRLKSIVENW